MKDTTFIIGYWKIYNNAKNNLEHYLNYLPKTLKILKNNNIVFYYYDDDILDFVKTHIKTDNIIYIKKSIEELETFKYSEHFLNLCLKQNIDKNIDLKNTRDKGIKHLLRDCNISGHEIYKKLFTIWTSKIYLVKEIIDKNPFNTNFFSWTDASISRIYKNNNFYRTIQYSPNYFFYFGSSSKYNNETLKIACGYMNAHYTIWNKVLDLYNQTFDECKNEIYGFDEEVIFHKIIKNNNQLFCNLDNIYYKILSRKNYYKNVSLKYGLVFVHIPKTGGTTIENLFFNDIENRIKNYNSEHFSIDNYINFNNFFSFTIVRNPYTRIISIYNYYFNGGNQSIQDKKLLNKNIKLNDFLRHYNKNNMKHLKTQASFINNNIDNINYIGKFENLVNEIQFIANKINVDIDIIHARKTNYNKYIITPSFINKINDIYNDDFELFNYNKITIDKNINLDDFIQLINKN